MEKKAAASIIQRCWNRRCFIRNAMNLLLYELYDREQSNVRTFMLIDEFLDKNIDLLIDKYNAKAKRLFLISFESYCLLREVPAD